MVTTYTIHSPIFNGKFLTLPFPTLSENPDNTTDKRNPHLCRPYVAQIEIHPGRHWNFNNRVDTKFDPEILEESIYGSSTILYKNKAILISTDLMWSK